MTPIRRRYPLCVILLLLCFLPGLLHGNPESSGFMESRFLEDSRRAMLKGALAERKLPFEERPLFAEYGSFGSSLHVSIPAAADSPKRAGTFILAVPLSFSGDDRRDLPYAVETALAFIDQARATGPKTDLLVAFLGDEWPNLPVRALPQETAGLQAPGNTGLRDLYSRLEVPEDTALIYLDMCREARELVIHHGAQKALAPLNLLKPLGQLCDSRKIPYSLAIGSNELYKLALADGPPVLEFALNRELPTLYLSESGSPGIPVPDTMLASSVLASSVLASSVLATMLLDYADSLDIGVENPDYHYLIFRFAGRTAFVPEYTTVLFFLAVAALFFLAALVYSVVFRFRLITKWTVFLKRSWILFLLYVLLILSLKGGTIAFQFLAGDAGTWDAGPGLFYGTAAAQILFGIALFTLLSPAVDLVYVPRRADFYGNASVILVALEILLAAFIDITFIPIFVWVFVFIFLAACAKKPFLVWLCCFLTVFLGLSSLRTLIHTGNRRLASLILSGNKTLIFSIALIALPLLITLKRGTLLLAATRTPKKQKPVPKLLKWLVLIIPRGVFLATAAIILWISVFHFTRNPVSQPELRTIDDTAGSFLKMTVRDRILLERRTLGITLEAPENPLRFNLYLDGAQGVFSEDEIPLIYAAPMPFRYIEEADSPNRNSIEFILGEGPPNPFTTEIVLPIDFTGFLRGEALYLETAPGFVEDYRLRIIRRYPIGANGGP